MPCTQTNRNARACVPLPGPPRSCAAREGGVTHQWSQWGSWYRPPPPSWAPRHSWSRQGTGRAGSRWRCPLWHLRSSRRRTSHSGGRPCCGCSCTRLSREGVSAPPPSPRRSPGPPGFPPHHSRGHRSRCARCRYRAHTGCKARGSGSLSGIRGDTSRRTVPRSPPGRCTSLPRWRGPRARDGHWPG